MKPIEVWGFYEAPKNLREALHDNGGDEDWLALIPPHLLDGRSIMWLERGSFGCCCINRYVVAEDGTLMSTRGEHDEITDGLKWTWLYDRPKFPEYAGYEIRVGCHS